MEINYCYCCGYEGPGVQGNVCESCMKSYLDFVEACDEKNEIEFDAKACWESSSKENDMEPNVDI